MSKLTETISEVLEKGQTGRVLFAIDCSASDGNRVVGDRFIEVRNAVNDVSRNLKQRCTFFDANVLKSVVVANDLSSSGFDELMVTGFGTSYEPIFEQLKKDSEFYGKFDLMVVITDGYCNYPSEPTVDTPVLWVYTTSGNHPPFGLIDEVDV